MARRGGGPDTNEMFRFLGEKLGNVSREPNMLMYKPHTKQQMFHSSLAKLRLYIGGNRSGKTVGGVLEDIYYLRGQHPYKKVPEAPVRGRAICVDYNQGIKEILIPKFRQWLPPSMLIKGSWDASYSAEAKKLTLANGSTLEFLTYEQNIDAHAGTSRHFVHFDEEPPKGHYDENMLRLVDTDGDAWLTLTPLNGMTWIYDAIYMKGKTGQDKNVEVVTVDIHENPYLSPDAIERILGNLDPDERLAREKGQFVQMGGLVFKQFDANVHVIPPINPKSLRGWNFYRSMDHGFNNATAWLWHAVSPTGTVVITFAEHYRREMTVKEHAKIITEMSKEMGTYDVEFTVGDPAIAQRNAVEGLSIQQEYAKHGIYIALGNNDVKTGVDKMASYLKVNPVTGKPYWVITETCPVLSFQMARLKWKSYASKKAQFDNNPQEVIHKKDDHAPDSARYFFSMIPDLDGLHEDYMQTSSGLLVPNNTITESYDKVLARMALQEQNVGKLGVPTEWTVGINPMEWDL